MSGHRAARILAGVLTALVCGGFTAAVAAAGQEPAYQPVPSPAAAHDTRIAQLLHDHDCWTGKAPADMTGKMPGHVVVTTRGGRIVYGGPRLVDAALDQVFNGTKRHLIVGGFCR